MYQLYCVFLVNIQLHFDGGIELCMPIKIAGHSQYQQKMFCIMVGACPTFAQ